MWFVSVEVEQETSAPPPKKNRGSAPDCGLSFRLITKKKRQLGDNFPGIIQEEILE